MSNKNSENKTVKKATSKPKIIPVAANAAAELIPNKPKEDRKVR